MARPIHERTALAVAQSTIRELRKRVSALTTERDNLAYPLRVELAQVREELRQTQKRYADLATAFEAYAAGLRASITLATAVLASGKVPT